MNDPFFVSAKRGGRGTVTVPRVGRGGGSRAEAGGGVSSRGRGSSSGNSHSGQVSGSAKRSYEGSSASSSKASRLEMSNSLTKTQRDHINGQRRRPGGFDEELSDDDSARKHGDDDGFLNNITAIDDDDVDQTRGDEEEEEDEETAAEKRVRMARQYLKVIEAEQREKEEDEEFNRDAIAHRLQEDVLERAGRAHKAVAAGIRESWDFIKEIIPQCPTRKGHNLATTCICLSFDDKYAFTGAKDGSIAKWDLANGNRISYIRGAKGYASKSKSKTKKRNNKGSKGNNQSSTQDDVSEKKHKFPGHTDHVLAIAISHDGKYLASGGRDKVLLIWNPSTMTLVKRFDGHRDAISGLAFRRPTHELFSASHDRTVKIWNLDEMTYVETLFGHQDAITSLDCLSKERPITSGGRDRSIRAWKVVEESQLVFNSSAPSIDAVRLLDENTFVSGSDNGVVSLWGVQKKKPFANARHGFPEDKKSTSATLPPWVISVAALPFSDIIASGSNNGVIHLWEVLDGRNVSLIGRLPVDGFVNGLAFTSTGNKLVLAVAQEHRLGRWFPPIRTARNGIKIIPLSKTAAVPELLKSPAVKISISFSDSESEKDHEGENSDESDIEEEVYESAIE